MKRNSILFFLAALTALVGVISAASLSYTPAAPQTGDSALVIANKVAAAQAGANSFKYIATATTTACKSGAGVLVGVVINTGGASSVCTLYDNTAGSGTKIAVINTAAQGSLIYGLQFTTGLTAVTATGTPADITIIYR